jgi:hypothetical protein
MFSCFYFSRGVEDLSTHRFVTPHAYKADTIHLIFADQVDGLEKPINIGADYCR